MRISDWSSDVCSSDLAGAECVGDLDVGVLAGCPGILLLHPLLPDFFEIVKAFVRPIDIAAPTQVNQRAVQAFADQVLLAAAPPESDLVDRLRAVEPFCRRIAGIEPRSLADRSEENTSELKSLMRISYAVFC